jgi:hypothetical protein
MGHIWIGRIPCMNPMQLIDMSGARLNVQDMSKMIQIRNVPDEMHRELKLLATAAGMSLSDYIKRELGDSTPRRRELEELDAEMQGRGRSQVKTENIVGYLREMRGD